MKTSDIHVGMRLLASIIVVSTGCSQSEPVRTVSWYQEHPDQRKAMVARCADDPGRLGDTANCINSKQAESIEGIGSFRKLPPLGLDPNRKPGFDEEGEEPKVRP